MTERVEEWLNTVAALIGISVGVIGIVVSLIVAVILLFKGLFYGQ